MRSPGAPAKLKPPRHYALALQHKHLPEMQKITGLAHPPLFTPVVCDVHSGLAVETFLPAQALTKKVTRLDIHDVFAGYYRSERFVRVLPLDQAAATDEGFFDITTCNGTNRADIAVFGHDDPEGQIVILTRSTTSAKAQSGAAIQCLNLMLGANESTGLSA